jgi:hypothetical protein
VSRHLHVEHEVEPEHGEQEAGARRNYLLDQVTA